MKKEIKIILIIGLLLMSGCTGRDKNYSDAPTIYVNDKWIDAGVYYIENDKGEVYDTRTLKQYNTLKKGKTYYYEKFGTERPYLIYRVLDERQ